MATTGQPVDRRKFLQGAAPLLNQLKAPGK
jgi:hypothetical protein